jgi:hypothetical protein
MLFTARLVPVTHEFSVAENAPPEVAKPAVIESPSAPIDDGTATLPAAGV